MAGASGRYTSATCAIGTDISFIGTTTCSIAELHQPPIAVIRRDAEELGLRAAELLIRRLAGGPDAEGEPIEDVVLPTDFLLRPSCAPPA